MLPYQASQNSFLIDVEQVSAAFTRYELFCSRTVVHVFNLPSRTCVIYVNWKRAPLGITRPHTDGAGEHCFSFLVLCLKKDVEQEYLEINVISTDT